MPSGIQIWNELGSLVFDSFSVMGGVVVGSYNLAFNAATTLTYPDFQSRTAYINLLSFNGYDPGITIDYALGYPRVTAVPADADRRFNVVIA